MKKLVSFVLLTIISFYSYKWYVDNRLVRAYNLVSPSTVHVKVRGHKIFRLRHIQIPYFGDISQGTGVIVQKNGLILTCNHMAVKGGSYLIWSDFLPLQRAYCIGVDKRNDLALLRVVRPYKFRTNIHIKSRYQIGTRVFTIGYPEIFNKYLTEGVISGQEGPYLQTTTLIMHGNSGSGLYDFDGNLVGLVNAFYETEDNEGWRGVTLAIGAKEITQLLKKYEDF